MSTSKAKGSAFELVVVKLIRKAVSKQFSEDICYRTPASGGHKQIGGGDIVIKHKLRKIFDWTVENKHRKTIKVHKFFSLAKDMREYLRQAVENCEETGGQPLLVIRGTRTPIFAIAPLKSLVSTGYAPLAEDDTPGLRFRYKGRVWKIFLFSYMVKELKHKADKMAGRE